MFGDMEVVADTTVASFLFGTIVVFWVGLMWGLFWDAFIRVRPDHILPGEKAVHINVNRTTRAPHYVTVFVHDGVEVTPALEDRLRQAYNACENDPPDNRRLVYRL